MNVLFYIDLVSQVHYNFSHENLMFGNSHLFYQFYHFFKQLYLFLNGRNFDNKPKKQRSPKDNF